MKTQLRVAVGGIGVTSRYGEMALVAIIYVSGERNSPNQMVGLYFLRMVFDYFLLFISIVSSDFKI